MIIYRKEPYPIQMRNIILLDDETSGGVIYVNKDTYDQALLLSGRMDGDPSRVLGVLKNAKNQIYMTMIGLKGLMENMMKTMPKPINMLAPFLIFCYHNQGIDWDAENREMAYGILHQFSQLIDFNSVTTISADARATISLPTALINQYQTSWDELCSSLRDKVVIENTLEGSDMPVQPNVDLSNMFATFQSSMITAVTEAIKSAMATVQITAPVQPVQPVVAPIQQPTSVQATQPTVQPAQQVQEKVEEVPSEPVVQEEQRQREPVTFVPAEEPKQEAKEEPKQESKSEDEQKADDVMAIIAAMKEESAKRDEERNKKMKAMENNEPKPAAPTAIHTNARSTAEEANSLNEVLSEFDF